MASEFHEAVAAVLRGLRPGDVVTYGEVAREAGYPGAARAVGTALRDGALGDVPWWRVVRADGTLPLGADQETRLEAEGVVIIRSKVRAS